MHGHEQNEWSVELLWYMVFTLIQFDSYIQSSNQFGFVQRLPSSGRTLWLGGTCSYFGADKHGAIAFEERREFREEVIRVLNSPLLKLELSIMKRVVLGLFWVLLHLVVSIVYLVSRITQSLESYIISIAQPDKYNHLQLNKLRYLAVVVDSEEALSISKVVWLSAIGVRHVSLYDAEGVLKKNKEILLKNVHNIRLWEGTDLKDAPKEKMGLEILSFSDGKEATAKAASFLYTQHLQIKSSSNDLKDPTFSEVDMNRAFKAVGCWGPEPDLLLIYGEARCHLGFPAWRLKYTELVHMGTLRSMKYGAILKAIYDFTMVQQNYGSENAVKHIQWPSRLWSPTLYSITRVAF